MPIRCVGFLSAAPSERTNYFKALLDITDLDLVRQELAKLLEEFDRKPEHPAIGKLSKCEATPAMGQAMKALRSARDVDSVERALRDAVRAVLSNAGKVTARGSHLSEVADALKAELDNRRARVFPLDQLRPPQLPTLQRPPRADTDVVEQYSEAVAAVDRAAARLIPVFSAVLAVPEISQAVQPLDCPVCATRQALSPSRIAELRRLLADNESLRQAARTLADWIGGHVAAADAAAGIARRAAVTAERWAADERESRRAVAVGLGLDRVLFEEATGKFSDIDASRRALNNATETWKKLATEVRDELERALPLTRDRLLAVERTADGVAREVDRLRAVVGEYARRFDALSALVSGALDQRVDTSGWASLLDLVYRPAALAAARRRAGARKRLAQAVADVEAAITGVLDNRFAAMSGEMRRWWETLRPGELVTFEGVSRRGAGKRFIDVKARLSAGPGRSSVLRDAISVLSDSQLNALGLATFLARCRIERAPLIVLDDPVPASDPEHRYTFADQTVSALLDAGVQLLVTTHDPELAELLQMSHAHRGVDEYTVILDDPAAGSVLLRSRDEFEHLLRKAEQQMYSPLSDNRKAAGQFLREAAERLAKQVIVAHHKTAGQSAKCSDLDGRCLRDLIPLVTQHAVQCDEPGKWRVLKDVLNPASHAAPPPESIALRNAHGNLRRFKKDHERSLPGLRIT